MANWAQKGAAACCVLCFDVDVLLVAGKTLLLCVDVRFYPSHHLIHRRTSRLSSFRLARLSHGGDAHEGRPFATCLEDRSCAPDLFRACG